MNGAPSDDRPQDRPELSAPRGAAIAALILYVFWGMALSVAYFAFVNLTIGGDPGGFPVLALIVVVAAPYVALALGIRWGRRWAMWVFRILTWLGIGALAISLAIGIALIAGLVPGLREQVIDAQFTVVASLLLTPVGWWLQRRSRTVRWLDPSSRPSEWEPPVNRTHRRSEI